MVSGRSVPHIRRRHLAAVAAVISHAASVGARGSWGSDSQGDVVRAQEGEQRVDEKRPRASVDHRKQQHELVRSDLVAVDEQ